MKIINLKKIKEFNEIKIEEIKTTILGNRLKVAYVIGILLMSSTLLIPLSRAKSNNYTLYCLGGINPENSLVKAFGTDNEPMAEISIPLNNKKNVDINVLGFIYNDQFGNRTFNVEFVSKTEDDFNLLKENEGLFENTIEIQRIDQSAIKIINKLSESDEEIILRNTEELTDENNNLLGITLTCDKL